MGKFNLRVYGILINDNKEVLVSDELIRGKYYTKFPGGGLEFGEGTRDCLKREFMEEVNLRVDVNEHIYTTDYYQESAFLAGDQIISIYYRVTALEPLTIKLANKPFEFTDAHMAAYEERNEIEAFRFIPWNSFDETILTLPIDKLVTRMVKAMY
jgi:8-oxo-dGTP diphosphatase